MSQITPTTPTIPKPTSPSAMSTNAEFERLFKRLLSRAGRVRANRGRRSTGISCNDDETGGHTGEGADTNIAIAIATTTTTTRELDPIVQNLNDLLTSNRQTSPGGNTGTSQDGDSSTISTSISTSVPSEKHETSSCKGDTTSRPPLRDLEGWARMVRGVIKSSQTQFRPLAEQFQTRQVKIDDEDVDALKASKKCSAGTASYVPLGHTKESNTQGGLLESKNWTTARCAQLEAMSFVADLKASECQTTGPPSDTNIEPLEPDTKSGSVGLMVECDFARPAKPRRADGPPNCRPASRKGSRTESELRAQSASRTSNDEEGSRR